jgi:chromosome segregation ATPase
VSEARRHAPTAGPEGGDASAHFQSDAGKPPAESPGIYEIHSSPSGGKTYSPSDMRLISYQNMQHRQEDMEQMQRLYDNLTQQLRRLFEEKTQLMDELAEARGMVMDLQTRLRTEADAYQNTVAELKVEFESQLRAARLLQQEAKDQAAVLRVSEKRYQETERDLNMRIADLDTQLASRVTELTTTRTSLAKAQQRVATLQDELAIAVSVNEDNEVKIQESQRKTKELSKTSLSKDELIASLQREVTDLHAKIKKPFTTSVKNIENTEKRINYEYEISMLKDSVLAIQESEAELQKEYLNLQAESKKEHKRLKDATTAEVTQLTAEHESEMEKMRKELHSRKRHLEQQTRLRSIAEDELAELRVQFVKLEEALTQCKLENSELAHGNELARNQVEELQDKLSAKQDEISKILSQLQRARKRIEKVELAHDEKDKAMAELNLRQQRLQQSIRSHAEREIDHLQALKHTMQSGASRLSAAEQVCGVYAVSVIYFLRFVNHTCMLLFIGEHAAAEECDESRLGGF